MTKIVVINELKDGWMKEGGGWLGRDGGGRRRGGKGGGEDRRKERCRRETIYFAQSLKFAD